jgi:hypothetical protein
MKEENEGTVKFLRLNTGEDIIAYTLHVKKDDFEDEHYLVDMPLKIVYSTNEDRNMLLSISLMQWVFTKISDNEEFKLSAKDVLLCSNASSHMTDFYYETIHEIELMKEKVDEMKKKFPSNEVDESMDYMDENEGLEMLQDLLEMTKNKKILH